MSLYGNLTIDGAVALDTNVAAITLAAASTIDASGGTNAAVALADVTGDFNLIVTGDTGASGSAITLDGADVNALTLTGGVLTLNGDVESDGALDFTSVDAITLGGNVVITGEDTGTKKDITFDAANIITGANTLSLAGDTVTLYQVGDGTTDPTQLTVTAAT